MITLFCIRVYLLTSITAVLVKVRARIEWNIQCLPISSIRLHYRFNLVRIFNELFLQDLRGPKTRTFCLPFTRLERWMRVKQKGIQIAEVLLTSLFWKRLSTCGSMTRYTARSIGRFHSLAWKTENRKSLDLKILRENTLPDLVACFVILNLYQVLKPA